MMKSFTRHIPKTLLLIAAAALVACGGGSGSSLPGSTSGGVQKHLPRIAKTAASPYENVVEQLYIAYFGRPADPAGLANFEAALAAANAPTDIAGLTQAYENNQAVRSLVDAFGTSNESKTLYGSGTTTDFVNAVFQNVLNRQPAQAGRDFWVNAVAGGSLSQGDVALAIMAGGLTNTTPQGLLDKQLILNRLEVAGYFTDQVAAQNATSSYQGSNAAALARAMLGGVMAGTDPVAYEASVYSTIFGLQQKVTAASISAAQAGGSANEGTQYRVSDGNHVIAAQVTMIVPPAPAQSGTVYTGLSLEPSSANKGTTGTGLLDPLLTWGSSCAPDGQPANYSTWWISGLYVNTNETPNCLRGNVMAVAVGDTLNISMTLAGTVWNQVITDVTTNKSVNYSIDLKGQSQNLVYLGSQSTKGVAVSNVQYSNFSFTMAAPEASACFPVYRSVADTVAASVVSPDLRTCQVPNASVGVEYLPGLSINFDLPQVMIGEPATLTWAATNADSCTANGAWSGNQSASGSLVVTPNAVGTYSYDLSCGGPGGTVSAQAALDVKLTLPPTVQLNIPVSAVNTGQATQINWSIVNATSCTQSGAWSGTTSGSGSSSISQSVAGNYTYLMTCTGPGGSVSAQATLSVADPVVNTIPIAVGGNVTTSIRIYNRVFASVTICAPGTSQCQTIDNIDVDTASTGLRIFGNLINSSLLAQLPVAQTASGQALGECQEFATSTMWGGVRKADVKMGGETAGNISVQIVGDQPGGYATIPTECSGKGTSITTQGMQGGNGVLGISALLLDCTDCSANTSSSYFACTSAGCVDTTLQSTNILPNPIAHFSRDNNGVVISLPPVGVGGSNNEIGTMTFGIGTQANNQLGSQVIYSQDGNGNFIATHQGSTRSNSFVDTGSGGLFFPDTSLPTCTQSGLTDFYCPASPTVVTFGIQGANLAHSGNVSFTIESLVGNEANAINFGGTLGALDSQNFGYDFGLPFYFGKTVYSSFNGFDTPYGKGPYIAF